MPSTASANDELTWLEMEDRFLDMVIEAIESRSGAASR